MDLYRNLKPGDESEGELVRTGRIASFSAIVIVMVVAEPLLGNFSQAFQYIQDFTGFFTPGVCALFVLGFLWPKTTAMGALLAALARPCSRSRSSWRGPSCSSSTDRPQRGQ